jgi:hypothetical protein
MQRINATHNEREGNMENIEIRNRWTNEVIVSGKYESIRDCLERNRSENLSGADLSGADLSGACLSGARLSRADLSGADLSGARLSGADLSGAYLWRADLSGACLSRARLSRAYLSGADLSGARLSRAYLSGADLSGADLSGAIFEEFHNQSLLVFDEQKIKCKRVHFTPDLDTERRFWLDALSRVPDISCLTSVITDTDKCWKDILASAKKHRDRLLAYEHYLPAVRQAIDIMTRG